ncbi:hypothetical protein DFP72DRAFT_841435 [Ephemerocybe angulata]|uniref:Uncharacterized protein n=1 Tax=Ephemerocybe angulata TaxID=980116 RepID=A0A8H6ID35_9AGAR|nr:hypothetical protein DFP72DRAFT_841435 [Tulosesus angulatus]
MSTHLRGMKEEKDKGGDVEMSESSINEREGAGGGGGDYIPPSTQSDSGYDKGAPGFKKITWGRKDFFDHLERDYLTTSYPCYLLPNLTKVPPEARNWGLKRGSERIFSSPPGGLTNYPTVAHLKTRAPLGYEVTDDIFDRAFNSPQQRRNALSSPAHILSPLARSSEASQSGGLTSKWEGQSSFVQQLDRMKGKMANEDSVPLEKFARSLPSIHPKENPLRAPAAAPRPPSQAPNDNATKIGEMAFEHLTTLYNTTNPDSAARSSAALLDAHMSNLLWIQSRLINHYENLIRTRNLIQKSIDAISVAAFTQTRAIEFSQMFQGQADAEENMYDGVVERTAD